MKGQRIIILFGLFTFLAIIILYYENKMIQYVTDNTTLLNDNMEIINYVEYWKTYDLQKSPRLGGGLFEIWMNKNSGYVHIFKNAGTTIENILNYFVIHGYITNQTREHLVYRNKTKMDIINTTFIADIIAGNTRFRLKQAIKNEFVFTYLRDPLQRFLSAYFEMMKRRHRNENEKIDKLLVFNKMTKTMKELLYNGTRNYFIDIHFRQQTLFLMDERNKKLNIDYIGMIDRKTFSYDLFNVIKKISEDINGNKFIRYREFKLIVDKLSLRNKSDISYQNNTDFIIDINELTNDNIRDICALNYLDYIVFPFELPKECDMDELYRIEKFKKLGKIKGKQRRYEDVYGNRDIKQEYNERKKMIQQMKNKLKEDQEL